MYPLRLAGATDQTPLCTLVLVAVPKNKHQLWDSNPAAPRHLSSPGPQTRRNPTRLDRGPSFSNPGDRLMQISEFRTLVLNPAIPLYTCIDNTVHTRIGFHNHINCDQILPPRPVFNSPPRSSRDPPFLDFGVIN
jgi:hypothetical protein